MKAQWFKVTVRDHRGDISFPVLVIAGRVATFLGGYLPGGVGAVWSTVRAQVEGFGWVVESLPEVQ